MDMFVLSSFFSGMAKDSMVNTHAISVPVSSPTEIEEIFDEITYNKVHSKAK